MDISTANVSVGTSLSISVSGTDYLRKSAAAGVPVGTLPTTSLQKDAAAGEVTAAQALGRVSADTISAIEAAFKLANGSANLADLLSGKSFRDGAGTFFNITA